MSNTKNEFKNRVLKMTVQERQELLKELQADLMMSRTKAKKAPLTPRDKNVWLLRKQIAFLKSVLKYKGMHYNPRSM